MVPGDAEPAPVTHPAPPNWEFWGVDGSRPASCCQEPGGSQAVEHRPWRMGILQAEGDLEHSAKDAPKLPDMGMGALCLSFPKNKVSLSPFATSCGVKDPKALEKKLFKKSSVPGLASPALPTSHVKNALESRQVFEMGWGERGHGEGRGGAFDSVSGFFHQSHIPAHAITLRESATTYRIHVEPI